MAISLHTEGSWVASNATTQTVTLPTHSAGDMLIVRVGMKHATLPGDITIDQGFTQIDEHNNGTTASSNGGGDVEIAAFYKIAESSSETNPTVTFHASVAATPGCAVATAFSKGSTQSWETPVGDSGSVAAATSYTATMGSHISATSGDWLVGFVVTNDNTTLTVPTISQTGLTLAAVVESPATALSSTTSNDISADGCYRSVTSGTSSAAAVFSGTNSVADVGAAMVIRLRVNDNQTVTPPTASLVTTASFPIPVLGPYQPVVLSDGPAGYWPLDEPSGTTVDDLMGSSNGSNSNCTVNQTGLLSSVSTTAYTFNGTTSNIDISYRSWAAGAGDRTTEAWVKTTSATTQAVVHFGTASSGQWWSMRVNSNGQLGLSLFGTDLAFGSAGALSDGVRHHIACTYDGTNVRAYIDGAEASGSPSAQSPNTVAGNAWIGTDGSNYFNGTIDEPAIYLTALSLARITAHYTAGVSAAITVTPSTASLTTASFAPAVNLAVIPPTATTTTTTFAPSVTVGVNVVPATASLTMATFEPTIINPQSAIPSTASLALTTFAPVIQLGIIPATASLALTANSAVLGGGVVPATASLATSAFAPVIQHQITVPLASLATTAFAPVIASNVIVPVASIVTTTYAPTVTAGGTTLQGLIDAATPGSTVSLGGLTYAEAVTVNKALTLQGPGTITGSGVRSSWVNATANNVVIDGVTFTNAASGAVQSASIDFNGVTGGVVRNCVIDGGSYSSIRFWTGADGGLVEDCVIHNSPVTGILAWESDDLIFQRNEIYDINLADVGDPGWEAGAIKIGKSLGALYDDNTCYNVHGPGLWADVEANDIVITNNHVYDCTRNGIHFEISDGADISGNAVWDCGYGFDTAWWGAGIISSSARNVDIHNNVVAWCSDGIVAISQDRDDGSHPDRNDVQNVLIHDNVIARVSGESGYSAGWFEDWVGSVLFTAGTNLGYDNEYWYDGTPSFAWDGNISSLASYNATPGEENGVLISAGLRDAYLMAAGIPVPSPTLEPPTATLITTKFAPVIQSGVVVPVATLALTALAPTIQHSVVVPVAVLSLTTFAPVINQQLVVTPGVAPLTLTAFAPTIGHTLVVPTTALTLTTLVPVIKSVITVPVASLVVTTYAPSVSGSQQAVPDTLALMISTYAPSVSATTEIYYAHDALHNPGQGRRRYPHLYRGLRRQDR